MAVSLFVLNIYNLPVRAVTVLVMPVIMMILMDDHAFIDNRSFVFMNDDLLMNNGRGCFAHNHCGSCNGMFYADRFIRIMRNDTARSVSGAVSGRATRGHGSQGEQGYQYECFHGGGLLFVNVATA